MRIRTIMASFLTVVMLMLSAPYVGAMEMETESVSDLVIIHDKETNDRIDELFALRNKLTLNLEENSEQIAYIDQQLQVLGVEEITYDEVLDKLGVDASPCLDVRPAEGITWTSRRLITTYYGQHYELQILEGVPNSVPSPLYREDDIVRFEQSGIVAGLINVIKTLGASAMGSIPVVGECLSAGLTLFDLFSELSQSMTNTTTIENVQGSAEIHLTTHMKYILVKPYQTPDYGHQATCYIGSSVAYRVDVDADIKYFENGILNIIEGTETTVDDYVSSKYYNDYSIAAKNYHNYLYNGITQYTYTYWVSYVDIEIFGEEHRFSAPYELPTF